MQKMEKENGEGDGASPWDIYAREAGVPSTDSIREKRSRGFASEETMKEKEIANCREVSPG